MGIITTQIAIGIFRFWLLLLLVISAYPPGELTRKYCSKSDAVLIFPKSIEIEQFKYSNIGGLNRDMNINGSLKLLWNHNLPCVH